MDKPKLLEYEGLSIIIAQLLQRLDVKGSAIPYKNYLSFPTVGKSNNLYLDIENNEIYRWDDENVKYYRIGTDYHNIEVINGGDSKG